MRLVGGGVGRGWGLAISIAVNTWEEVMEDDLLSTDEEEEEEEEEYKGRTDSNSPAGPNEAVCVARDENNSKSMKLTLKMYGALRKEQKTAILLSDNITTIEG